MSVEELKWLLLLMKVEGIGDITAKKLLSHFGNALDVFKASENELAKINGIGLHQIKNIKKEVNVKRVDEELNFIAKNNIKVYSVLDDDYPSKLKHCPDAPVLLFSTGNINLDNSKIISIVGTRKISNYGSAFCEEFLEDIAVFNPIIISGFAFGTDILAHKKAMDLGLQTVGVLAHGLDRIYPKEHKMYISKVEENGGLLTEFWSKSFPDKENFVKRNRIVAGLSEATIVIESPEKGGSLITAHFANDYDREVFALPGRYKDVNSVGCNNLIKTQRASMITSAADLVYMLNWDVSIKNKKTIQTKMFLDLSSDEQLVFNYLKANGKELLDVIALDCNLPIYKLTTLLLELELKGIVRPLPGKKFELIE